jgi:DNA-3-methyladenine glycosylase
MYDGLKNQFLPREYYLNTNVVDIARNLLGKHLITCFDGNYTESRIVETEAYQGPEDQASHARNGLLSNRNAVMYEAGGYAYVYLIYGIHHLFNVVTAPKGVPHAVLIRAVEPLQGIKVMMNRRNRSDAGPGLTAGPGILSKALGINTNHSGMDLCYEEALIQLHYCKAIDENNILSRPRVGVDYAGEWAKRPWRFSIRNNRWVSKAR